MTLQVGFNTLGLIYVTVIMIVKTLFLYLDNLICMTKYCEIL